LRGVPSIYLILFDFYSFSVDGNFMTPQCFINAAATFNFPDEATWTLQFSIPDEYMKTVSSFHVRW